MTFGPPHKFPQGLQPLMSRQGTAVTLIPLAGRASTKGDTRDRGKRIPSSSLREKVMRLATMIAWMLMLTTARMLSRVSFADAVAAAIVP